MTPSKVIARILEQSAKMDRAIFRGHGKASWKLHSGAVRRLKEKHGDQILEDKKKLLHLLGKYHRKHLIWPMQIIDGKDMSDIQRLSILQHQRAATGFLDFTEDALVALWFACDEKPRKDGAVLILDIGKPWFATNGRNPNLEDPFDMGRPVVFYEPDRSLSPRIVAQQSVFVICDPSLQGPHLKSVPVPREAKEEIQNYLKGLGMSETRLFGDVPGLAAANKPDRPLPPDVQLTPDQYRSRGNRAYQQAQYEAALEAYESYVAARPDIAEPYCLQGDALAALGRFREAIEAYTRAIENMDRPAKLADGVVMTPDNVSNDMLQAIYYNRGNAHAAIGDHRSAIQDFSTALEQRNEHEASLLYNRGNSKYMLRRFPEAHADFEAAWWVNLRSNAALAMGNCKVLMGEFDEAMHQYFNGSARPPESAAAGCKANVALLDPLFKEIQGHDYEIKPQGFTLTIVADREPASYLCTGNSGNSGNIPSGLRTAQGGAGYPGARGFVVKIVRRPTEP